LLTIQMCGERMVIDQVLVNAAGARWGLRRRPGRFQPYPPNWPAAARIDVDHWTVELSVPWDQIGGEVHLRPHTPHSLHIAANSVGLVTVKVGDKHRTLQLNRTIDRVKVAFVTSGQVRDT